jgi:PAS domain S-box-containing protein
MSLKVKLSLLLLVAALHVVLDVYIYQQSVQDLRQMEMDRNNKLAQIMAASLEPNLNEFLAMTTASDATGVRKRQQLRSALFHEIANFNVLKAKIYDRRGITIFSTLTEEIGQDKSENIAFQAALAGKGQAGIVQRNTYNTYDQLVESFHLVQSYLPIRDRDSGDILGVFELYGDAKPLMSRISGLQYRNAIALMLMFVVVIIVFVMILQSSERFRKKGVELNRLRSELERFSWDVEEEVKRRTHDLKESNTMLEKVLDGINDPVMVIGIDFRVSAMNQAARRLGLENDCGKDAPFCYQVSHRRKTPCDGSDHICTLQRVRQTERSCSLIHTHHNASGEPRLVEVSASPLRNDEGVIIGVVEVLHDITDRERIAVELKEAKEVAEESVAAKSQFLANMSHELRTPLNAIIGMAEVLERTPLSTQQKQYMEILRSSSGALLNIIDDTLSLSKLEFGKYLLNSDAFNLRGVVDSVVDMLGFKARRKGLELLTFVEPQVPCELIGDAGAIRQILLNLIGNAVKFTDQGEVELRISPVEISEAGCLLRFIVRDTGKGILPNLSSKIFQPFERDTSFVNGMEGGSGLGLAICNSLIKNMEGHIGFQCAPEQGTTFWFEVMLGCMEQDKGGLCRLDAGLAGSRVLVVDDSEAAARSYLDQLQMEGLRVDMAAESEAALELIELARRANAPFKVVIVDSELPDGESFELVRSLRSHSRHAETRIMMLSPVDEPISYRVMHEAGIDLQIPKPVKQTMLLQGMDKLLASPAGMAVIESEEVAASPPTVEQSPVPSFAAKRVMVVEDHPLNREVARVMLEHRGCEVVSMGSAEDALAALRQQNCSLVFMDCELPGMNGLEATKAIRRLEGEVSQTSIIALTAQVSETQRKLCIDAGMDDFLAKPITEQKLTELLNRWLPMKSRQLKRDELLKPEVWDELRVAGKEQPEFIPKLVEMFLSAADQSLADITSLLREGKMDEIARQSHRLQGSCNQVGAHTLVNLCAELTKAAKQEDREWASRLLDELIAEMAGVRQALLQITG